MLNRAILFGISGLILLGGCSPAPTQPGGHPQKPRASLGNPAAARCLRDGYRLEFIYSPEGIPLQGLCVNDKVSAKCEEWAYLRGECRLDKATAPPPLPSLPLKLELESDGLPELPKVRRIRVGHG
jgi:putative hemolysin